MIDMGNNIMMIICVYANGEVLMQYNGNHKADKYFYPPTARSISMTAPAQSG